MDKRHIRVQGVVIGSVLAAVAIFCCTASLWAPHGSTWAVSTNVYYAIAKRANAVGEVAENYADEPALGFGYGRRTLVLYKAAVANLADQYLDTNTMTHGNYTNWLRSNFVFRAWTTTSLVFTCGQPSNFFEHTPYHGLLTDSAYGWPALTNVLARLVWSADDHSRVHQFGGSTNYYEANCAPPGTPTHGTNTWQPNELIAGMWCDGLDMLQGEFYAMVTTGEKQCTTSQGIDFGDMFVYGVEQYLWEVAGEQWLAGAVWVDFGFELNAQNGSPAYRKNDGVMNADWAAPAVLESQHYVWCKTNLVWKSGDSNLYAQCYGSDDFGHIFPGDTNWVLVETRATPSVDFETCGMGASYGMVPGVSKIGFVQGSPPRYGILVGNFIPSGIYVECRDCTNLLSFAEREAYTAEPDFVCVEDEYISEDGPSSVYYAEILGPRAETLTAVLWNFGDTYP